MYWNDDSLIDETSADLININMRCIEIIERKWEQWDRYRLTLTWDVLKWHNVMLITRILRRLTLTWDVLKCFGFIFRSRFRFWLTLTWDVLKSRLSNVLVDIDKININMRCIEIKFCQFEDYWNSWLTLTWDVLKYGS